GRHQIWAHVRGLRARGHSVLISTNYVDEAEALCDRVAVLQRGRLIAEDTPEGLLERAGRCVDLECGRPAALELRGRLDGDAAVSFIAMVSLFGLTGSRAPMALVNQDRGPYGARFVAALERDHHSFSLRPMTAAQADARVRTGGLAGSITIPRDFSERVGRGETVAVEVVVDNVHVDLTNDLQRPLPAAIMMVGPGRGLPGLRPPAC